MANRCSERDDAGVSGICGVGSVAGENRALNERRKLAHLARNLADRAPQIRRTTEVRPSTDAAYTEISTDHLIVTARAYLQTHADKQKLLVEFLERAPEMLRLMAEALAPRGPSGEEVRVGDVFRYRYGAKAVAREVRALSGQQALLGKSWVRIDRLRDQKWYTRVA